MAIADPDTNLVAGPNRHQKKAPELRARSALLGKAFRQVGTDRFARTTQLLGKAALLACRKRQARSMHLQRDPIGSLEHLQILERSDRLVPLHSLLLIFWFLVSEFCLLTSAASVRGLSPVTFSAQDDLFRPVSYYAFFKGWLLLSQPPGCLGLPTSFPT